MPTNEAKPRGRFHPLRPTHLDWYLFKETLFPFLGGMIFFILLFLMFQLLRLSDFLISHGVPTSLLMKLIAYTILSFLPSSIPIALLMGILNGFGKLSAESEITAMKALGLSIYRIAVPIFIFAFGVALLTYQLSMTWVPQGERMAKVLTLKVGNTKVVSGIKEGTFTTGFFDLLIFADKVDQKTNELKHVFIFDERDPKNPVTVVSKKGQIASVKTTSDLSSAVLLKLQDGNIHRNNVAQNTYQKINFDDYKLYLKVDEGKDEEFITSRMHTGEKLRIELKKTDLEQSYRRSIESEYYRRIATALSPFVFALLAIGFGTFRSRSIRASAVLITVIVTAVYWSLLVASIVWAERGAFHPAIALQIPNLLILIPSIFAFKKAAW